MSGYINVSIIIPTYNSLDELRKALCSIEKIDYNIENFEVIVIDDGSTDQTKAYLADLLDKVPFSLVPVFQENRGPAAARNAGIRKSMGDYILVIDSDCYVDNNIIREYLNHFPCEGLAGVGGEVLPLQQNYITKYLDYRGIWRPGFNNGEIAYLVTANAFFCKKAVLEVGGFDEDFRYPGGEEPELCYRLKRKGYFFKYEKNATVTHSHRTDLKSMIKMFKNHGIGLRVGAEKWNDLKWSNKLIIDHLSGKTTISFALKAFKSLNFYTAIYFSILEYMRIVSFFYGYYKKPLVRAAGKGL